MKKHQLNNNLFKSVTVTNGCGGKKGLKCGVEVYILPSDTPLKKVNA